jgi:hypothetical protein
MSQNNLTILQGKTFSKVFRWESGPLIHKPISAISIAEGAPRLTVTAHGLRDGWRVAVTRVKGMTGINAKSAPPKQSDYRQVTVVSNDIIEFNRTTPVDEQGREWPAYSGGGFIQYNTPVDLEGYSARLVITDTQRNLLMELTSADGDIILDNDEHTITVTMTAEASAAISWSKALYELELTSPTGVVPPFLRGIVTVTREIAVDPA